MRVRPATPDDARSIRSLAERLLGRTLPTWRDPAPVRCKRTEALDAYDRDAPDNHLVLVCEEHETIVGYAHAGLDTDFFSGERQGQASCSTSSRPTNGRGPSTHAPASRTTWSRWSSR